MLIFTSVYLRHGFLFWVTNSDVINTNFIFQDFSCILNQFSLAWWIFLVYLCFREAPQIFYGIKIRTIWWPCYSINPSFLEIIQVSLQMFTEVHSSNFMKWFENWTFLLTWRIWNLDQPKPFELSLLRHLGSVNIELL